MKNKVLVILAVSAAALGSAIFAAPANAVQQEVQVEVTIQPGLYLRTFQKVRLDITQGDLSGNTLVEKDTMNGAITNGSTPISRTAPGSIGAANAATVQKTVKELFAVWGNTDKDVAVTVTPGVTTLTNADATNSSKVTINSVTLNNDGFKTGKVNSATPVVGGADFVFGVSGASAGSYAGGTINVNAAVP